MVTGGARGLGYYTAEQVAAAGDRVVVAARDDARAAAAVAAIRRRTPTALVETVHLDLADLESVAHAAAELAALGRIDAVVNNGAVLRAPTWSETADGFELQFGTNHLGHFALIAQLMPTLLATPGARVVHVGSIAHRFLHLDFSNLMMSSHYSGMAAYCRSKLAVMLFGFELDRRLRAASLDLRSVVAHPGYSRGALSPNRTGVFQREPGTRAERFLLRQVGQGKHEGAAPLVMAATSDSVRGGQFWGPSGWQQLAGPPALVRADRRAFDHDAAARLWRASEQFTALTLPIPMPTNAANPAPTISRSGDVGGGSKI